MKLLSPLFPIVLKAKVKAHLLGRLYAKPEITARISTRVVREGVPRYLDWTYEAEKNMSLRYVESLRVGDYAYKFAQSSPGATLYASSYACMLLGMHGELENVSESYKNSWLDYLDSFQDPADGLFRDPALACPAYEGTPAWGDGWGARHLTSQLIISYARLGRAPRHPFTFLEPFYTAQHLQDWLGRFDFTANVWSQSNYIMNVYTLLQYARDHMGEQRAAVPLASISQWLLARQRPDTGMWHDYSISGYPEIGDAIRGAYHFYPLFVYEGQPISHADAVIDSVLHSQNSWGGFNPEECPSGACEDIDAIDPLIRASKQSAYRQAEVILALKRAMVWILSCQNRGGGYESIPEHATHYGDHPLTTSRTGEANLFATWFRTLCLAYVVDHLSIQHSFSLGFYPGYEIQMRQITPISRTDNA